MVHAKKQKYVKVCLRCSIEFETYNPDKVHCVKHRLLSSPAYIASLKHRILLTDDEKKQRKKKREASYRLEKGMKPLALVRKEAAVKKRKVTSAIILPVIAVRVEVPETKPEPKIWLQVDKRTRIGFIDNEQRDKWKEKHNFNN